MYLLKAKGNKTQVFSIIRALAHLYPNMTVKDYVARYGNIVSIG